MTNEYDANVPFTGNFAATIPSRPDAAIERTTSVDNDTLAFWLIDKNDQISDTYICAIANQQLSNFVKQPIRLVRNIILYSLKNRGK